ncbi:ribosomal protein S18-alanine N-acetyltransferase [Candidatus Poriferisodalis sp.]|uniref:ribosomal protein S18-alanine N-acetyltransferase n=1 Tax=Candidatus Poriferisodalis sp. TaxID=3101277 RepID=UPI003B02E83A
MSMSAAPGAAASTGGRRLGAPSDAAPIITEMRRKHLREIRRIDRLVYPRPWSMALYLDELQRGGERVYRVACQPGPGGRPGGVIGYGGFMIVADEGHITSVAVHPDCQGRGVGARLMLELHRAARRIDPLDALSLEVRVSNTAAQRLYRWFGYVPVGIRMNYYRGGPGGKREDALVMWCADIGSDEHGKRLDGIATALGLAEGASSTALGLAEGASSTALGLAEGASNTGIGVQ